MYTCNLPNSFNSKILDFLVYDMPSSTHHWTDSMPSSSRQRAELGPMLDRFGTDSMPTSARCWPALEPTECRSLANSMLRSARCWASIGPRSACRWWADDGPRYIRSSTDVGPIKSKAAVDIGPASGRLRNVYWDIWSILHGEFMNIFVKKYTMFWNCEFNS